MNPCAEVLHDALKLVESGDVDEVFVMYRDKGEWVDEYLTGDVADMLFALQSARIRIRIDEARRD
jgi:hypothetical protein